MLGREDGDLSDLTDPAGTGDIGLQEIHRISDDEIFERVISVQIFTDRDGYFALFTKSCVTCDIFNKERFFEPEHTAARKSLRCFECNIDGISLVRVGHDGEVVAELRAHGTNDSNVLGQVETNFDFYAMKGPLGERASPLRHFRRFLGIKSRRVHRNLIATLAAQQFINRHSAHLAENVPKRDVDAAQRNDANAPGAELFMPASDVSLLPNLIDLNGIHADQQGLQNFRDDHFHKVAVSRAGAEPRNSFVGINLNQRGGTTIPDPRPAEHLPFGRYLGAQANRLDVGDLHWCLRQLPEFSFYGRPVHDDEFVFFLRPLVAFGIDAHDLRLVVLLRAHAEQRQRLIARALEIVIMILGQHDAFAFIENNRLMLFIIEGRPTVHHDENMVLAGMRVKFVLPAWDIVVESDRHVFRTSKRNVTSASCDLWCLEFKCRSFHF